jgi:hypothetical protein
MHPGPDAFLNQVVGGRWRALELFGATPRGAAFRVEALADGRSARLELWDQRHVEERGELARFEREARTLSRLRHERCLTVIDFGVHAGRPFLVTDLPPGTTLRDALGKAELTVGRAVSLGLQLCDGLRHLHRHGTVHRALLPENVWVGESPAAELLKLGLPRIGPASPSETKRERFYMPPERPAARVDYRADLYAVGMLLYVMCTGREPPDEVVAATTGGAPVPAPRAVSPGRGISEGLERVIMRAVAPSPEVRFGTVDDLMAALQAVGARPAPPKKGRPAQRPQKVRPAARPRQRTAIVAAALAGVALLGAGALRGSGRKTSAVSPAVQAPQPPSPPAPAAQPPSPPAPVVVAPPPRAAIPPPPVEPKHEAAPVAAPAAPAVATSPRAPSHDDRSEIWSLLDGGRLDEGAARIKSLVAADPDAAWPHFALGALYYRRYWRPAAVKQWQVALERDPALRHDPQLGAYLCFMLDDAWKAAGVTALLTQLGPEAAPLLQQCVASAKTPRLRAFASRALDGLGPAGQR